MTALASWEDTFSPLPEPVERHFQYLLRGLKSLLGPNLVALIVHGSLARGEYRAGISDVDLLVVVEESSPQMIATLSEPLRLAHDGARVETIVMMRREISGSHDVFPLFYDEISECHILLAGNSPFEGVEVSDVHRRLRIEQELRATSTHLRRLAIEAIGRDAFFTEALEQTLRQLRYPLLALLKRRHVAVTDARLAAVYTAAAAHWNVPLEPLLDVSASPFATFESLFHLLGRAIDDVDQEAA